MLVKYIILWFLLHLTPLDKPIKIMKLSLYTDNTMKVLLYVASHTDHRCTRVEIAEYFNLAVEPLRKVIHQLNKWGYVNTYSGRNGGLELAVPANEINLGDLIFKTEKQIDMFDCANQNCRLLPSCSLNRIMQKAEHAFFDTLRTQTLGDLVNNKETLVLLQDVS